MPHSPVRTSPNAGGVGLGVEQTDRSLVRQFRAGNQSAANKLYRRYANRLKWLARTKVSDVLGRRLDDEDIVQSVFRRFFNAARDADYDVPDGHDLWDLLLVITLNKIRSEEAFCRAAKRDMRLDVTNADGSPLDQVASRDESADAELRLSIAEALDNLPATYGPIVRLRMEGHEVAEIAQLTSRAKRTVERILQESRNVLAQFLNERD